jgi:hypothetical protein
MRRDFEPSISCKINPDDERPEEEQCSLRKFSRSIKDFNELPSLIDEATTLMGLGAHVTTAASRAERDLEIGKLLARSRIRVIIGVSLRWDGVQYSKTTATNGTGP